MRSIMPDGWKKKENSTTQRKILFKMKVGIDYNFCGLKNEWKKKFLLLSFIYCERKWRMWKIVKGVENKSFSSALTWFLFKYILVVGGLFFFHISSFIILGIIGLDFDRVYANKYLCFGKTK